MIPFGNSVVLSEGLVWNSRKMALSFSEIWISYINLGEIVFLICNSSRNLIDRHQLNGVFCLNRQVL